MNIAPKIVLPNEFSTPKGQSVFLNNGWLRVVVGVMLAGLLALLPLGAEAANRNFGLRYQVNTNGNIVLVGNTVMQSTGCTTTGAACEINNNSTMGNVDADSDASTFNSSSADLSMPSGANVLFAGLYWGASSASPAISQLLFKTPASFGYSTVTATSLDTGLTPAQPGFGTSPEYGGFAEVTAQVRAAGSGTYWVANIQTTTDAPGAASGRWGGWGLVVVYEHSGELLNNLTVFDGYQIVNTAGGITIPVSGFLTPYSGPVVTRLALIGWDGDSGAAGGFYTGDQFQVNGTSIYDACNPVSNDFFNSTVCNQGVPNSVRNPAIANTRGVDIDLVNLPSGTLANGATSANLRFTTTGEYFGAHMAAFATNLYVPNIASNVVKTVQDINGGDLVPGDVLRYTISLSNTGQDTATDVILTDNIPAGTTYKPNSLSILTGYNSGVKSDNTGDDQAEYIGAGTPRVVFRLGNGADGTNGGLLPFFNPPPAQTSLQFDVTVNSDIQAGTGISNTAYIAYGGQTLTATGYSTSSAMVTAVVLAPPVVNKSFLPTTIDVGGVSQLKIIVSNPAANPAALTGVTFADTYPAGLVNANPASPAISCTPGATAGTLTGGAVGGNTIGMNPGATLPPGGSCTITVNVTAAVSDNYLNSVGATSTNGGSGAVANATLSVGKINIAKAFSADPILVNAPTRLTLTVTNPMASAQSNVTFTDTYPAGLVNGATPNLTNSCGGTATATAGAGQVSLSGGNLAGLGSCTVAVDVTSPTAGTYVNTSGGVSSTQTVTVGNPSNSASVTVIGPPQAGVNFNPAVAGLNTDSQMTITVSNPNQTVSLSGVAFTDNYPANLINSSVAPNATLNCTSGSTATLTGGAASGTSIGISGGSLAPGGSCTVTVNVRSGTNGSYTSSTGSISSSNGGTGSGASATLTVSNLTAPTITKAFAPTSIATGGTSTLTITLSNSNGTAITGAAFTDTYPSGLVNDASPAASTTCVGGAVTANVGAGSLSLSGATIPATGNCTVTVPVTSTSSGYYNNNIPAGALTSANAGVNGAAATAQLTVAAPPLITKSFNPTSVATGANSTMTITFTNPNSVQLTGVGFGTDTYPTNLNNTNTTIGGTCTGGTRTAVVDGGAPINGTLTVTGLTLAANSSCTVTATVRSTVAGTYTNTTPSVTSTQGGTGGTASATLSVAQPAISKAFAPATINTSANSTLTITLSNPTGVNMTAAAFTDNYPSGIVNAALPATNCGGTVSGSVGGTSVGLSGGTIPAGGSCTVTVSVTGTGSGTNTIPIGGLTVNGGASNTVAASATLTINPAPIATKTFLPATIGKGGTSTLTISVQNSNNAAMTGVSFTDNYPGAGNLVNSGSPSPTISPVGCTGTLTAAAGGTSLALTGATIPLNSVCNYSVQVTSAVEGSYLNDSGAVTSTNYGIGAAATATLTVTPSPPTAAKGFSPAAIMPNASAVMTITLSNPNTAGAVTGVGFTDFYPPGLVNAASANPATTCSGGSITDSLGNLNLNNGSSLKLSGATIPANSSCTVTVNVTAAVGGTYTNQTGTITTANTSDGVSASGVLTVISPPSVAKAFSPVGIIAGASSTLTITLTNPNSGLAATGVAFTDTYPAGLVNAATPAAATTCGGGTASATAGGGTVALSNGTIPAGGSCTVTVSVTSTVGGTHTNTIAAGAITTANVGTSTSGASAGLTVLLPIVVDKSFTPSAVVSATNNAAGRSLLLITLTNPNTVALTGIAFTDNYPQDDAATGNYLRNRDTDFTDGTSGGAPDESNTCGATATTGNGSSSVSLAGGSLAPGASCTIGIHVYGNATGNYVNTLPVGGVTTAEGANNTVASSATFSVGVLGITKTFSTSPATVPATIGTGTTATLTLVLTNPTGTTRNLVGVVDNYPAGLVNAAVPNGTSVCSSGTNGTVTAAAGGNSLTLAGASLTNGGGICTVTVNVTSATAGTYTNTTNAVTINGSANSPGGATASDVLTVLEHPTVTKGFSPASIAPGATSTLTITLANSNAGNNITGVAFTDTYPSGLVNAASPAASTTCGGTVTATAGLDVLSLSGGTIPASGSCTVTVPVTSNTSASYTNTLAIGSVTSTNGGDNLVAGSAGLTVLANPNLVFAKTVAIYSDPVNTTTNPKNIPGADVNYTMRVTNTGLGPVDGDSIEITDPVPADTTLFIGDMGGGLPFIFTDGSPLSSGLACAAGCMTVSVDGTTWSAVPAGSYDPTWKHVRFKPTGTMVGDATSGSPSPYFEITFRVQIN